MVYIAGVDSGSDDGCCTVSGSGGNGIRGGIFYGQKSISKSTFI